ncbi:cyclin-dependent protein kinase inhibitor [Flagelloscypha sp. PMI_526]|nr:cyclin-dependent protein kinase inhibitor [Flagelloscypha sp. PMI_526]
MEFFNDASDPLRPSLFELVAQEQLRDLLQPALKYVLAVFAQRYPRYLIRIVNRHEEFYAGIMVFVERYYLRKYNASFSENFYGMKRRRRPHISTERTQEVMGGVPAGEKLRDIDVSRSLFFLVGVPYLRAKAQDYYELLGGGLDSNVLDENELRQIQALTDHSIRGRLRRLFKLVYPWINVTFEGYLLLFNISYLFDKTPFYRPWLKLLGLDLRRLGVEDLREASRLANVASDVPHSKTLSARARQLILQTPSRLVESLRFLLPTAIFFVKFLEWWYSPSSPARTLLPSNTLGPIAPPPRMLRPHPQGIPFDPARYGHCPVCQEPWRNATALPSGYMFCYRCAYDAVEKDGRCPVTLIPARVWQLKKVLALTHVRPSSKYNSVVRLASSTIIMNETVQLFGKYIQSHEVPGWSQYYLDYKFLKKIISSLSANKPASEAAALALGVRPADFTPEPRSISSVLDVNPEHPPIFSELGSDGARGPDFQAHKAAFFFKLERELEKINGFYLQKEAELKLRLETLLSKRRAAAMRGGVSDSTTPDMTHAEWSAAEEGFRLLERDLNKLQQFVEINATGFRKILKKFDKRSTSSTKELYLARQVEVQPVFNRQLISELSDTVAACLVDLTDLSAGLRFEGRPEDDIFTQQIISEHAMHSGPFHDLEKNLRKAIANSDATAITECVQTSELLARQPLVSGAGGNISRILWNAVIEAPVDLADLILGSLSSPFDFQYVDDINSRTCLHEAAIAGELRLVNRCIDENVEIEKVDQYGRTALHYAAMNGHAFVCQRLLEANSLPSVLDKDNYSPLVYSTLRGHVDCVKVLLHTEGIDIQASGDASPLSLASQGGHVEVVSLLLQRGARCRANTNGEYPMHLAAREGHHEVCRLLVHSEGWDLPDKYHEWTPVFHAARYGHTDCLRVLLQAGSQPHAQDELGHFPVHYAAWYGHNDCLDLLLASLSSTADPLITTRRIIRITDDSPLTDDNDEPDTSEIDLIPPISLPPPIMPPRVYGHNYLDRTNLVQVKIGGVPHKERARNSSGVKLYHHLISSAFKDEYFLASTPLKLVMTTGTSTNSAPYTIPLPQRDEPGYFAFQIPSTEPLSLHFSLYPNFGTKTIGRAVALPSLFTGRGRRSYVLPILDTRLHIIGEVAVEVNIITAFQGVTLEVGGNLETYWKSVRNQATTPSRTGIWPPKSTIGNSTTTSPATHSVTSASEKTLTISSLKGDFLRVPVQLTRDLQPVVYSGRYLPHDLLEIPVHSVTLSQFETLALRLDRTLNPGLHGQNLAEHVSASMISLPKLFQALPSTIQLILDLECHFISPYATAMPTPREGIDINLFADTILATVHATSYIGDVRQTARKLALSSCWADMCSAVNWKQPNYPVFFDAGRCTTKDWPNLNTMSLGAALEFARADNLLGVFVNADLFSRVPSLMQGVRNLGFLVGINEAGESDMIDQSSVDIVCRQQVVTFIQHPFS